MFEGLSERLDGVFKKLRGLGKISEENVTEALKEVRLALLEADVNFKVVKEFLEAVKTKAVGAEVLQSLTPGQVFIKIVHEEMTRLLGGSASEINWGPQLTVILMAGLQGAGKTTATAKLALWFRREKQKRVMMAACDLQRPAAVKQLQSLGAQIGVPVYAEEGIHDPVGVARRALDQAKKEGMQVLLVDTAGRLHVDAELMDQIRQIHAATMPQEILLVVDAMVGQDAVNSAKAFHESLPLTGILLTKLDGDARGGAALSVRQVTGVSIKFAGVGEKVSDLEAFYPDRMASRILGMGDVLTLVEKAQKTFDQDQAEKMEKKLREGQLDLEMFLEQLQQIKRMGGFADVLAMIPGASKALKGVNVDEGQIARSEAIIRSMTLKERRHPDVINGSRRRRIAQGSGTNVTMVNDLLKQFEMGKKLMKGMMKGGGRKAARLGRLMPF